MKSLQFTVDSLPFTVGFTAAIAHRKLKTENSSKTENRKPKTEAGGS